MRRRNKYYQELRIDAQLYVDKAVTSSTGEGLLQRVYRTWFYMEFGLLIFRTENNNYYWLCSLSRLCLFQSYQGLSKKAVTLCTSLRNRFTFVAVLKIL